MSTITPTVAEIPGGYLATWPDIAAGDDCEPLTYSGAPDRTAQVFGTFGGASITVQGTLEAPGAASNWASLTDPQGNALTFSSSKVEAVTEVVRQIRPAITGGDGTTSLTVHLLMRSAMR